MAKEKQKIKIGFDLDGVIIGKPPVIPRSIIEWLYRSHKNKKIGYRYPKTRIEIMIRVLSHYYYFRPPIRRNLSLIEKLASSDKVELYFISSRYSFLENKTNIWFDRNGLSDLKKKLILNTDDEQPHIFKEHKLKELKIDYYVEDDPKIVNYLNNKLPKLKIIWAENKKFNLTAEIEDKTKLFFPKIF